ncbi:pectate lyase [Aquibacillus rhizosphaerae]|uniref:Pectate lyase n=1 Tax=Aquibacillus rhizosphaerae TaxID=3051431 RepID=A0ABT7L333_9BACI|nr:pectate lyase [Aquibacillus sp. LR5S19]MDL4839809.1 pectate lyase [Aquibacillus sp. LR5S19]
MKLVKRIGIIGLIFMLSFTSLFTSIPINMVKAATNFENVVIFEDNFDNDTIGAKPANVEVSETGGNARVVEEEGTVNKHVYLEDTSDTESVSLQKSFEQLSGVVTVEMSFMQPSYTSSTKVMRLKGDGNSVTLETKDGYLSYRNSDDTYQQLIEVEENTWYDIKVEVDLDNQSANVSIDDALLLENAAFYSAASTINFLETFTPGSGAKGHYIDNLKLSQQVEVENPITAFEHDFNSDVIGQAPSDVDIIEAGGTITVDDILGADNKSVFLDDTSESEHVSLSKSFQDLAGNVTAEMSFMQPSYTSSTKVMRIKGDATPVIIETKNDSITYRTGSNYQSLVTLEENTWYDVRVEIDLDGQTADVYINDELTLDGAALNETTTKVNYIETFTPNSGVKGHYIDNLKVTGFEPVVEEEPTEPTDPEDPGTDEPSAPVEDGSSGVYEAENAQIDAAIIDNKHVGFTGTGFVDYSPNAPGGWIEWTVDVPVDGIYNLDFRYAHGGTDQRPSDISVNGELVQEKLAFAPSGGWATWVTTSMKAELKSGENVIRATGAGASGGANIDHLKVLMEVDDTYEAEDAVLEQDTVIIDNKHVGFTGTGFIDYNPNAPGSWVEWTVDVPVEGEYNLDFRYGHGGTDKRPAKIEVNGEIIEESLAFDPSGGWATWVYTSTKALLQPGENVIRATGVGASGGANIDHLRVHNKPDSSGDGPIDVEDSDMAEVVSDLQLQKLNKLGIVADGQPDQDNEITRIEFMSLVNDAFGFVKEEKFKNLSNETSVWEISLEEWYSYVLETAKDSKYMDGLINDGKVHPNQKITNQEAAQIITNITGDATNSTNTDVMTWKQANEVIEPYKAENSSESVNIVGVHAVASNIIAVTLNSQFETFDFSDIDVVVPTRQWELLSPGFENLRIDKAAKGTNKFGQTVLVLHSLDEWNEYAEYEQDIEEVRFSGDLDQAIEEANNLLTWQMEHGGWTKNWPHIYQREWDGQESRSEWVDNGMELGTIDNDATIAEMLHIAQMYQETGDIRYKESTEKAIEFLFNLQYDSGGFAQVYPARGNYSDYVTFNDEAMINVLELMDSIVKREYPFDSDLISDAYRVKVEDSIDMAVDYILNAQIKVDDKLTAWCAQHHPVTYEPMKARAYEHASISGQESVGIIRYLMSRPQTEEINKAVTAALEWLDEVKLENTRYVSGDPNEEYFVADDNSTAWYRFYEIGTNKPIFSGRDGVIKHEIMEIEAERRNGYSWGGHWATQLLEITQQTGNYNDKVFVQVASTNSVDTLDRKLVEGEIKDLDGQMKQMGDIDSTLTVAKDGSGDYDTVQAAIDAVPNNNTNPVTIYVKDGTYKEVLTVPANKPFITMIGESEEGTVITYDNFAGRDNGVGGTLGTSGSASVYLRANDFHVENVTFENSFDETLDVDGKQAVAVYAAGDRQYFKNVRFISNQDTLYTHSGSQYYTEVYIEGDVDFIFGGARVVIEDSVIHSLDRGSDSNNGYITAASTMLSDDYGMLIKNSKLTSDAPEGTVYLGRPWPAGGNPNARGSVVYMNSELGAHIKEEGWTSMSGLDPMDARLYEYQNNGDGAAINESRRQLTDEQAAEWTVQNVLNGWDPSALDGPGEVPGDGEEPGDGEQPGEVPGDDEGPGNGEQPGEEPDDEENPSDVKDPLVIKPEVKDNRASIRDNSIENVMKDGELVIDLSDYDSSVIVSFTKEQVEILRQKNLLITIKKKAVEIQIPSSILTENKTVDIGLKRMKDMDIALSAVYDFSIKQGDIYITNFDNDVTLNFVVDSDKVNDSGKVKVQYWNPDEEEWQAVGGQYDENKGQIIVGVSHFSTFTVFETTSEMSKQPSEETTEDDPMTGDKNTNLPDTATNTFNYLLLGLFLLVIGGLAILFIRKRKHQ